ncbi:MAG: hypothetical protein IRY91_05155, partial [Gemmatimonadaceae bacterium]|nr:hypothetical protein [Gemmatimonadaceae bacterium]
MTAATEIAASRPFRRPAWLTDDAVRKTVVVLAALAVPIGFALHQFIRPFPWLGAGLIFFLAAATRTFGIPLPGKGFASFTVGPAMAGVAALGWA